MQRLVIAALVVATALAQDLPTAAAVTEPGRTLARPLDVVLGGGSKDQDRTILVLLDPSAGSREVVDTLLAALDAAELPVRTAAWSGLQQVWRGLFPYRRFEFERSGYQPNGADRAAAIAVLRSFWNGVR